MIFYIDPGLIMMYFGIFGMIVCAAIFWWFDL